MTKQPVTIKASVILIIGFLLVAISCGPGGLVTSRKTTSQATATPTQATSVAVKTSALATTTAVAATSSTTAASPTPATTKTTSPTISFDSAKSLQAFLTSTSRHFKAHYEAFVEGKLSPAEVLDFEVWSKPGAMRLDQYRNGALDRTTLVTTESAKVYFYSSKNVTEPINPPAYYLALWNQDYSKAAVSGSTFTFNVNAFYKKNTAVSGYYMTDVKYAFDGAGTMTQTCYGNASSGARPASLNIVVHAFSVVDNNAIIATGVFSPPF